MTSFLCLKVTSRLKWKKARKMIDMRKIQCVCYHYDKDAPIKSKKIEKALIEVGDEET